MKASGRSPFDAKLLENVEVVKEVLTPNRALFRFGRKRVSGPLRQEFLGQPWQLDVSKESKHSLADQPFFGHD